MASKADQARTLLAEADRLRVAADSWEQRPGPDSLRDTSFVSGMRHAANLLHDRAFELSPQAVREHGAEF
jgi:hypothetical protein